MVGGKGAGESRRHEEAFKIRDINISPAAVLYRCCGAYAVNNHCIIDLGRRPAAALCATKS